MSSKIESVKCEILIIILSNNQKSNLHKIRYNFDKISNIDKTNNIDKMSSIDHDMEWNNNADSNWRHRHRHRENRTDQNRPEQTCFNPPKSTALSGT